MEVHLVCTRLRARHEFPLLRERRRRRRNDRKKGAGQKAGPHSYETDAHRVPCPHPSGRDCSAWLSAIPCCPSPRPSPMTGKGSPGSFAALPTARPAGHPEQRTHSLALSSVGRCVGFSCSDRKAARQPTARQPTVRVKRRNPQDSLLRRSPTVHSSRTVGCSSVDPARSSIRPIHASGHIRIALVDLVRLPQARHRSENSSTHDSGDEQQ